MRKSSLVKKYRLPVLLLFFLLAAMGCSSGDTGVRETGRAGTGSGGGVAPDETSYAVPAEKAQLWEDLKKVARKDYDVCLEHCGSEQVCLDRCASVYKTRLENDYKRVTQ